MKVRVLYPKAFSETVEAGDEVELEDALATSLISEGFAEAVSKRDAKKAETKAETKTKTETAVVKLDSDK